MATPRKRPEDFKKNGRPTLYRPEYDALVVQIMREGAGFVEFCAEVGISKQTGYDWQKEHPSFLDAFTRAQALCQAWWERQGRLNLVDESKEGESRRFNDRLWNKNVACRFRDDWADSKNIEVNSSTIEKLGEVLDTVKNSFKEP